MPEAFRIPLMPSGERGGGDPPGADHLPIRSTLSRCRLDDARSRGFAMRKVIRQVVVPSRVVLTAARHRRPSASTKPFSSQFVDPALPLILKHLPQQVFAAAAAATASVCAIAGFRIDRRFSTRLPARVCRWRAACSWERRRPAGIARSTNGAHQGIGSPGGVPAFGPPCQRDAGAPRQTEPLSLADESHG